MRKREIVIDGRKMQPHKIICVARKYEDHAKEMGRSVPAEPIFFLKPTTALLPDGGTILLPPESSRVEVETELAVIVGRDGRDIGENPSMRHVAGYAVFFDITARDLQTKARQEGSPWTESKGFDAFAPISRAVRLSRVRDLHRLPIQLRVNGVLRQDSHITHGIPDTAASLGGFANHDAGTRGYHRDGNPCGGLAYPSGRHP